MRLEVAPAPFYTGETFFGGSVLPLLVMHMEPSGAFPPHEHDFTEIVVVYGGSGRHVVNDRVYVAGPGDIFILPPGTRHEYARVEKLCYLNVLFDAASLLDRSLPGGEIEGVHRHVPLFALREIIALANRIDQELYRGDYGCAEMARACFQELWIGLARLWRRAQTTEESTRARIERIVELMREDPAVQFSVQDMARESGTCERNFHRMFRRLTGSPPLAFLNRLRVDKGASGLHGDHGGLACFRVNRRRGRGRAGATRTCR